MSVLDRIFAYGMLGAPKSFWVQFRLLLLDAGGTRPLPGDGRQWLRRCLVNRSLAAEVSKVVSRPAALPAVYAADAVLRDEEANCELLTLLEGLRYLFSSKKKKTVLLFSSAQGGSLCVSNLACNWENDNITLPLP